MRWLVTLAPDAEPYASGVKQLQALAQLAGWAFAALGDAVLQGDRPWQAKRFALRWAFEQDAERVFWCDADVVVTRPERIVSLLNQDGPPGVWVPYFFNVGNAFGMQAARNAATPEGRKCAARAEALYRELCASIGVPAGKEQHFEDWITGYALPPEIGLRLCDAWDAIAERMRSEGVTWSDGLSVGLAAAVCRVPIFANLRNRTVRGSITHLLHSYRKRGYGEWGACLP